MKLVGHLAMAGLITRVTGRTWWTALNAPLEKPDQILLTATKVVMEIHLFFLLFHHGVSLHSHIHYCDANKYIG